MRYNLNLDNRSSATGRFRVVLGPQIWGERGKADQQSCEPCMLHISPVEIPGLDPSQLTNPPWTDSFVAEFPAV